MSLSRSRVHLIFVEKERARFEHLKQTLKRRFGSLDDLPVTVHLVNADADAGSLATLTSTGAWRHPILAVFDSWGNVNVSLETMRKIAINRSSEVLVTFGPNWFTRREDLNVDILDSVFGGKKFWSLADREVRPDERWRAWLETYRSALERAGFKFQLDFRVVPRTGLPLHLVYGTNNDLGVREIKEAMWTVDGQDGMGFDDPRTRGGWVPPGQLAIWGGDDESEADPELCEAVVNHLASGESTIEGLRTWLLLQTARWRQKDAQRAVTKLKRDGIVELRPDGRITKNSIVKLL